MAGKLDFLMRLGDLLARKHWQATAVVLATILSLGVCDAVAQIALPEFDASPQIEQLDRPIFEPVEFVPPVLALGPHRAWVVAQGTEVRHGNISTEMAGRLRAFTADGTGIDDVAFTPQGGWAIVAGGKTFTRNVLGDYFETVNRVAAAGHEMWAIAFNPVNWARDRGFVLVHEAGIESRNVPQELTDILDTFHERGDRILEVAFTPAGGWTVLTDRADFTRNVGGPAPQYYDTLQNLKDADSAPLAAAFIPDGYDGHKGWVLLLSNELTGAGPTSAGFDQAVFDVTGISGTIRVRSVKGPPPEGSDSRPADTGPRMCIPYDQDRGLTVAYRDMGVMLHHTRSPFRISPRKFHRLVTTDPNWEGHLDRNTIRMVLSDGKSYDVTTRRELPADVIMGVYEDKSDPNCRREYCVVSYRGTDRDHVYFREEDIDYADSFPTEYKGEHEIPMSTDGTGLPGRNSCTVKSGYLQNYDETRSAVIGFLGEMTSKGRCSGGVVVLGMSLGAGTANVAAADLYFNHRGTAGDNLGKLLAANKFWMATAGSPRAIGQQCASTLNAAWGDRVKRFVYGSESLQASRVGTNFNCGRFIDPVAGNPSFVRRNGRVDLSHWGEPLVGYVSRRNGYQPSSGAPCFGRIPCESRYFANDHARVAGQGGWITSPSNRDYGGKCPGPGLIPAREYMFGRLHDTCSYRNLMAVYGQKLAGEPARTNYRCVVPTDERDPSDYPKATRVNGIDKLEVSQAGPIGDPVTRWGPSVRQSCRDCRFVNYYLTCTCAIRGDRTKRTRIDTTFCRRGSVFNDRGELTCSPNFDAHSSYDESCDWARVGYDEARREPVMSARCDRPRIGRKRSTLDLGSCSRSRRNGGSGRLGIWNDGGQLKCP